MEDSNQNASRNRNIKKWIFMKPNLIVVVRIWHEVIGGIVKTRKRWSKRKTRERSDQKEKRKKRKGR